MKKSKKILTILTLAFAFNHAHAKSIEIAANPLLSGAVNGMGSSLDLPTSGGSATFTVGADLGIKLTEEFQLSVPVLLVASSSTLFQLSVGPQYNFGDRDSMNKFFTTLRPGIMIVSGGSSFILNGAFGKRFKIADSVSFRPSFGITFVADTSSANIYLMPASFSVEL